MWRTILKALLLLILAVIILAFLAHVHVYGATKLESPKGKEQSASLVKVSAPAAVIVPVLFTNTIAWNPVAVRYATWGTNQAFSGLQSNVVILDGRPPGLNTNWINFYTGTGSTFTVVSTNPAMLFRIGSGWR